MLKKQLNRGYYHQRRKMKKKFDLDIDLVSDAFYEALIEECQKRYGFLNAVGNLDEIIINNIQIKFEVDK